MSQYYQAGGVTLWNPSNGASRLFLRQVALFETEVGLPSGIGPMADDEAEVRLAEFELFVGALLAWRSRSRHAIIAALSDGLIATLLVLAERAGVAMSWPEPIAGIEGLHDVQVPLPDAVAEDWTHEVRRQARQSARFMPR